MKTMIMTVILMSVCLGINHSLKADTVVKDVTSMSAYDTSSSEVTIQSSQQQLKQELTQSIHTFTSGVKQTAGAVIDVVTSVIAYAFLSVGQVMASIVLD
jgi:hypothetical protein